MKARGLLAVLTCALTLLSLPASAVAKPGYYVSKPLTFNLLDLRGSHGYSVHVLGYSEDRVAILLHKGSVSATYNVRGRVTEDTIEGRFGSRGRISVRLRPGARVEVEENEPGCKGKPSVNREGRFIGMIRFQGEQGFTSVRARSARGFAHRSYRQVCKRRGEDARPPRKQPPTTSLSAVSSRYPRAPWFSVYKLEPARPAAFSELEEAEYTVNTVERRTGMLIFRSASAQSPPETFAVTPIGTSPVTATVAPPAPFSGTATYEKRAGGQVSWSGDLAVELPGRGEISLVDPTYKAKLCRSFACACPIGQCFFVSIGAGSSQAERLRRLAARLP